jgi:uncharacterized membrane protein YphA (DoxX/SURF4 family)
MSNAGATRGTGAEPSRSRGRAANVALWALRVLLAVVFAMAGLAKLGGDPAMVEMFATIGVGQWFRYVVGALEVSGAVGVLIPRLSGAAALGLVCLMAGATLANLFVLGASPLLPLGLLVAAAVVVRGGWPQTAAPAGRTRR